MSRAQEHRRVRTTANLRRLAACFVLLSLGAACIPVPYASPPIRVAVGGGRPFGATHPGTEQEANAAFVLRGAVHPGQLMAGSVEQPLDLGVGYVLEDLAGGPHHRHGPYLEGGWRLWRTPVSPRTTLRLSTIGMAELLVTRVPGGDQEIGGGATLGIELDLAGWAATGFTTLPEAHDEDAASWSRHDAHSSGGRATDDGKDNSDVIGFAFGEWAVGAYAAASVRHIANETSWLVTGGLTCRLPASLGLILIWNK